MTNSASARRVVVLAYRNMELLDACGPINVFTAASRLEPRAAYDVRLTAEVPGPVTTAGGVDLVAPHSLRGVRTRFDTLLVPGALGIQQGPAQHLVPHLPRLAKLASRVVAVCSGALLLAQAGLLDGRRAATHWAACAALSKLYPTCKVDPDAIFVRDGSVWTSAGVTAGIDLALGIVEQDHGPELALEVARWLVVYLRRPGGQSQFSAPLATQQAAQGDVTELVVWARDHLREDLSVERLAARAAMSTRNFARVFARATGHPPARFVERLRVEAARSMLEGNHRGLKETANACGFKNVETMHRAFRRVLDLTPREYEQRFAKALPRSRGQRAAPLSPEL